jgi:hypothetical protein
MSLTTLPSLAPVPSFVERFGERTGFDPAAYVAFVLGATKFLEAAGLKVTRMSAAVVTRPADAAPPGPSRLAPAA